LQSLRRGTTGERSELTAPWDYAGEGWSCMSINVLDIH